MIETERLVLRPPASDDLPWLREEMNSEAVMRHLGGARNDAEVADGLAADIAAFAEPKGWRRWTIWRRDDDSRKIGRAACRARVYQYVTILVVAVSLKNKKIR